MLYQKLLMGTEPYYIGLGTASEFENHRHHEIEISFCFEGSYDIICENTRYTLNNGDFAIIPSMASHSIPKQAPTIRKTLTIELGYVFLGKYFDFLKCGSECVVISKENYCANELYKELIFGFKEIVRQKKEFTTLSELLIRGNLCKISAILLKLFQEINIVNISSKENVGVNKIDKALEMIYNRYNEPLPIDEVSNLCGYNKSNFCKIFKNVMGSTFHETLNRHRVEVACVLLKETDSTVEEIAQNTGFTDLKSFCRVFKKCIGMSAGQYRKNK